MQILAAIAIIILLFIAYNYMNKNNQHQDDNNHYHPKSNTGFKKRIPTHKNHDKNEVKKGKILNFMEYKNKFSNTNKKK